VTAEEEVSTVTEAALTSTVSETCPVSKITSTLVVLLMRTSALFMLATLKPDFVTLME